MKKILKLRWKNCVNYSSQRQNNLLGKKHSAPVDSKDNRCLTPNVRQQERNAFSEAFAQPQSIYRK